MKKLLVVTGALVVYGIYCTKNKVTAYKEALKTLVIKPFKIEFIDLGFTTGVFKANVTLQLINNSQTDIAVESGGLIKLTKLQFYTFKGKIIGEAFPEISNISIPAQQPLVLDPIPVSIELNAQTMEAALDLIENSKDIKVIATISALGKTYTIQ